MRYNDPNRPITLDDPRPEKRHKENQCDHGNIHSDGFRTLKRRPRSKWMVDSIPLKEAKRWE